MLKLPSGKRCASSDPGAADDDDFLALLSPQRRAGRTAVIAVDGEVMRNQEAQRRSGGHLTTRVMS